MKTLRRSISFFHICLRGSRVEFRIKNQSLRNVLEHTFFDTAFCADCSDSIYLFTVSSYYDKRYIKMWQKDQETAPASILAFIRMFYPRKNVVFMVPFDTVFEALSNETRISLARDFYVINWQAFWYEYAIFYIQVTEVIERKYWKDTRWVLSYIPFDREKKDLSFDI